MVPASQPSRRAARGGRVTPETSAGTSQPHASSHQSVAGKASAPSAPEAIRTTRDATRVRAVRGGSGPTTEPIGQDPRQSRGQDLAGRRRVVVDDPPHGHGARLAVPDRVAGAGVAVAWLPHAPDVHELASPVVEPHPGLGGVSTTGDAI